MLTDYRTLSIVVSVYWHYYMHEYSHNPCLLGVQARRGDGATDGLRAGYLSIRWGPDELIKAVFHLFHECHVHSASHPQLNRADWLRNALNAPEGICNACASQTSATRAPPRQHPNDDSKHF